jgi:prolyl-tRNA synthetase
VKRNDGEKVSVKMEEVEKKIPEMLKRMHGEMFEKAKNFFDDKVVEVSDFAEFKKVIKAKGIVKMNWCGEDSCENAIKDKTGASTRCMPLDEGDKVEGKCLHCGKDSKVAIYFSRCY